MLGTDKLSTTATKFVLFLGKIHNRNIHFFDFSKIIVYNKIRSQWLAGGLKVLSMDSLYCLGNSLLHCYNNTLQQQSENNKNIILLSYQPGIIPRLLLKKCDISFPFDIFRADVSKSFSRVTLSQTFNTFSSDNITDFFILPKKQFRLDSELVFVFSYYLRPKKSHVLSLVTRQNSDPNPE